MSLSQSRSSGRRRNDNNTTISQTQPLSQEEQRDSTKNMIKYILNLTISKTPIKKADMIKNVLGGNAKAFNQVSSKTFGLLKSIYGYKVIEVADSRPVQYICVSVNPSGSELEFVEECRADNTLLFLILSYIFMKNGCVYESTLFTFLDELGISEVGEHEYFHNVKKKIDLFIKQLYLKKEKETVEGMHDEKIKLSWGFRATYEFAKRDVLDLVSKLLNKPTASFPLQYSEAYGTTEMEVDEPAESESE